MMISRMFQRNRRLDANPTGELRLPSVINTVFENVMHVERRIIRLGIRFPVGGSQFLIARKP
uniref:Uncharacterized protein n=1 Tax=Candidatus Kentrum sp. LPFa TaxID=2126335 RepID=A0A450WH09_9GAMM|nr:MAG: hypothetical protein BECKLPF1236A_GA0070988_101438 [Candidatus Kentron sp. LPFa]VFK31655.1 MAG: hypothetical protein BECKLPF1236C_GA0070990_101458 [Candidatus Kentron sp. LPFa]